MGKRGLMAEETYDLLASGPGTCVAPRPLSLRSNFSWTFAGNVVYAGCQWGMLMVLAKLGSPEWSGQFALGLAVTAPIIMLTNLQLRAIQATDARREYRFGHYLALRLATTALALLVIAGIAAAGIDWKRPWSFWRSAVQGLRVTQRRRLRPPAGPRDAWTASPCR